MKLKVLAAVVAAAALPVLAQTSTPVEPRQARVEVSDPAATATAPKKASKTAKASKHARTAKAKKPSKKKAAKKPQTAG
jgi:hypothetical protein